MRHYVDVHVGERIRRRRWMIKMTQKQLADVIGIKFQQVQKYETGANRVSASRLFDISNATGVDVSFFFEGLKELDGETIEGNGAQQSSGSSDDALSAENFGGREALDLLRHYFQMPETPRRRLLELARSLAKPGMCERIDA